MSVIKPFRRNDVIYREAGDGDSMLYDAQAGLIHVINSTAAFVWDLCDGSRTIDEILNLMEEHFDVENVPNLSEDVIDILRMFEKLGLLSISGGGKTPE